MATFLAIHRKPRGAPRSLWLTKADGIGPLDASAANGSDHGPAEWLWTRPGIRAALASAATATAPLARVAVGYGLAGGLRRFRLQCKSASATSPPDW